MNIFTAQGQRNLVKTGWARPQILTTSKLGQRRLDPGMETPKGFFQVQNQKEYQNVVIISFLYLKK